MPAPKVLAIVLAGGEGKRLMPLTAARAKPAVPFGGTYRLVDFALSNLVNSRYLHIVVLTQYKSHSMDRHIARTWRMSPLLGNYVAPVPAQQRRGKHWYLGSADAIYQTVNIIEDENPDYVVIVGADHVYRMDFSQMVDKHIETGADFSVAGIRQPIELADQFGVIEVDKDRPGFIKAFLEKPTEPEGLPDSPHEVLASMGNYVASVGPLLEALKADAESATSKHDMGGDIVPHFVDKGTCGFYDFVDNDVPGSTDRDRNYWRDVGTLDSYYDAHMDLIAVMPIFNVYNHEWPLHQGLITEPPAKFTHYSPFFLLSLFSFLFCFLTSSSLLSFVSVIPFCFHLSFFLPLLPSLIRSLPSSHCHCFYLISFRCMPPLSYLSFPLFFFLFSLFIHFYLSLVSHLSVNSIVFSLHTGGVLVRTSFLLVTTTGPAQWYKIREKRNTNRCSIKKKGIMVVEKKAESIEYKTGCLF